MQPDKHLNAVLAEAAGHQPQQDGSVGPGCLSQWWPASFTMDSVNYLTAEHWMMAGEARLFGDDQALAAVLAAIWSWSRRPRPTDARPGLPRAPAR